MPSIDLPHDRRPRAGTRGHPPPEPHDVLVGSCLEKPEHIQVGAVALAEPGETDVVVDVDFSGISTGTEEAALHRPDADLPRHGLSARAATSRSAASCCGPKSGFVGGESVYRSCRRRALLRRDPRPVRRLRVAARRLRREGRAGERRARREGDAARARRDRVPLGVRRAAGATRSCADLIVGTACSAASRAPHRARRLPGAGRLGDETRVARAAPTVYPVVDPKDDDAATTPAIYDGGRRLAARHARDAARPRRRDRPRRLLHAAAVVHVRARVHARGDDPLRGPNGRSPTCSPCDG